MEFISKSIIIPMIILLILITSLYTTQIIQASTASFESTKSCDIKLDPSEVEKIFEDAILSGSKEVCLSVSKWFYFDRKYIDTAYVDLRPLDCSICHSIHYIEDSAQVCFTETAVGQGFRAMIGDDYALILMVRYEDGTTCRDEVDFYVRPLCRLEIDSSHIEEAIKKAEETGSDTFYLYDNSVTLLGPAKDIVIELIDPRGAIYYKASFPYKRIWYTTLRIPDHNRPGYWTLKVTAIFNDKYGTTCTDQIKFYVEPKKESNSIFAVSILASQEVIIAIIVGIIIIASIIAYAKKIS